MRKQREEEYMSGNLTAMIDVVFQLIIFFVCTVNMQEKAIDDSITLAMAPHGTAVVKKDPREINIDVDNSGRISIARERLSEARLTQILKKVAGEYGIDVPVIIRGDSKALHESVKGAMDACATAGFWKIKMGALKEKGG